MGMEVEAVVLHIAVDQAGTCLELTADAAVVRDVSRRAEKPNMTKAAQGQTIKGQVALIKDDFVLVTLRQHAVGMMAFVPRRQVNMIIDSLLFTHQFLSSWYSHICCALLLLRPTARTLGVAILVKFLSFTQAFCLLLESLDVQHISQFSGKSLCTCVKL